MPPLVADLTARKQQLTGAASSQQSAASTVSQLIPWRGCVRVKRLSKKDMRTVEREYKRRRLDWEEAKKKKMTDFHKNVLNHRDLFLRFHKAKRSGTLIDTDFD